MIAGSGSHSGKTTVACGLLEAFRKRGLSVGAYKTGPDYIDPQFLRRSGKCEAYNLDTWLMSAERTLELFAGTSAGKDIAVVEGAMGLYDGGLHSTAGIAKLLKAPVILVMDAKSLGESGAAIALGFREYDPDVNFAGVILNRTGSSYHERIIADELARLGIKCFGGLRRDDGLGVGERHLGLVPADEGAGYDSERLRRAVEEGIALDEVLRISEGGSDFSAHPLTLKHSAQTQETPDFSAHPLTLKHSAQTQETPDFSALPLTVKHSAQTQEATDFSAHPLTVKHSAQTQEATNFPAHPLTLKHSAQTQEATNFPAHPLTLKLSEQTQEATDFPAHPLTLKLSEQTQEATDFPAHPLTVKHSAQTQRVRIGVARDDAFSFYYPESLAVLEAMGAELEYFSPIHDKCLPKADGYIFGGGFPEMFADELSANASMLESVRTNTKPVLAECGGYMYLCRSLRDFEGRPHKMAGVIPADAVMTNKPILGYMEAETLRSNILCVRGRVIRGHEFHYSRIEADFPEGLCAFGMRRRNTDTLRIGGYADRNILASYLHINLWGNPELAERFINALTLSKV